MMVMKQRHDKNIALFGLLTWGKVSVSSTQRFCVFQTATDAQ